MSVKPLFLALFPTPRRRPTARSALVPVIFLGAFVIACVILELTHTVLFTNTWPFGLLLVAPWIWWMSIAGHSGLSPFRAQMALLARLALMALFIVVLAEPRTVRKHDEMTIVYAVDASASITPQASDNAMKYVVDVVSKKPQKDEAALVFFGRDAAVELPPATSLPFEDINVQIDRDGTNLSNALSLAAAMVPEDRQGRIVLISDGVATEGTLPVVLDDLKGRGIAVDVMKIQYNYEHEVWLERLVLPRFVKSGETYETTAVLSSLKEGQGRLVLQENGQVIFSQDVQFQAGKNAFSIPIYMSKPGYYEYAAYIEVPEGQDSCAFNNKAISYLYLKGRGSVLLVTDPKGDPRDVQPMLESLQRAERQVETVNAYAFPRNPMALLDHNCIVFVNVPADALGDGQMQALHDAVYHQGSGFLMVGGENSFGPGGYKGTPVAAALPVSMDISQKKVLPKGALAIILHTCEFAQGNEWGKRITKQAMKVLSSRDEVGVLVFDYQGGVKWLFPLTPAGEYERLVTLVNAAQIGDMPSFVPTMQMGLAGLQKSDAATKHMIIISDGDPQPPPPSLIKQFVAAKVTVSMIAINPHGGSDISKMRSIAQLTGGRYYFPKDPNKLPSIFIKEAKKIRRTGIQNKTFVPKVYSSSPVIKGFEGFVPLHGYVLTMAKPRATTILRGPEKEELDPVLSTWRYGVGAAAAFTSDLSTNWGADWVQWDQYDPFVKQLVTEISRPDQATNLRVRAFPAAGEGVILAEDYSPQATFMEVRAEVKGPRNITHQVDLKQVGASRYEGRFPLSGEGRYQIVAAGVGSDSGGLPGSVQRAHSGFVVPYSQEFMRFRSNPIVLDQIARKTNGRNLTGGETGEDVYGAPREARRSSLPVVDWLLALMAILVPLDVGLRRVQLDLGVIKGWFGIGRKAQPSAATFGALLARKKDVSDTLKQRTEAELAAHLPLETAAPLPEAALRARKPEHAAPKPQEAQPTTTTARLLAAKRRALEDQDEAEGETK